MRRTKKLLVRLGVVVQIVMLSSGLGLNGLVSHVSANDSNVTLSGTITGPGGERLGENIIVNATSQDGSHSYSVRPYSMDDIYTSRAPDGSLIYKPVAPGSYSLQVVPGIYEVSAYPLRGPWNTEGVKEVNVLGPTTVDFHYGIQDSAFTISGTFKDSTGAPVPNAWIQTGNGGIGPFVDVQTNASGEYSMKVPEYQLGYFLTANDFENTNPNLPSQFTYYDHNILFGNNDIVENLQLPATEMLHVLVKDKHGSPVPGQRVVNYSGYVNPNDAQNPYSLETNEEAFSGQDGVANILVWQGYQTSGGAPCAYYLQDSIEACANDATYAAYPNIEIAEADGYYLNMWSPTNLVAHSPALHPVLTWQNAHAYPGEHYMVFRDGLRVAVVSDGMTYTDMAADLGAHTYYVVAGDPDGADPSGPSNNVTVQVVTDASPPSIGYTATPAANAAGWNKGDVTVNFSCSDDVHVVACSAPVTLSSQGANQTVTGTATDEAGNSTSITTNHINIDKTGPATSGVILSSSILLFAGTENISASASDALSGVSTGEYYLDTDPGQGHGVAMSYSAGTGKLTASKSISFGSLSAGSHTVYVRSQDKAGNWSAVASKSFTYL